MLNKIFLLKSLYKTIIAYDNKLFNMIIKKLFFNNHIFDIEVGFYIKESKVLNKFRFVIFSDNLFLLKNIVDENLIKYFNSEVIWVGFIFDNKWLYIPKLVFRDIWWTIYQYEYKNYKIFYKVYKEYRNNFKFNDFFNWLNISHVAFSKKYYLNDSLIYTFYLFFNSKKYFKLNFFDFIIPWNLNNSNSSLISICCVHNEYIKKNLKNYTLYYLLH